MPLNGRWKGLLLCPNGDDRPSPGESHGLLTRSEIKRRVFDKDPDTRLIFVPLIDEKQIGNGAIDLRLGSEFIVSKRLRYAGLDPLGGPGSRKERLRRFRDRLSDYQERIQMRLGDSLTLHPQQFALGSSLEYVRLPPDIASYVVGRSSWGRMGLVIATATMVHPGFVGSITLELANIGDAPISLYPGSRVAQLAIHRATPTDVASTKTLSRYAGLTGPGVTSLDEDPDWELVEAWSQRDRTSVDRDEAETE